MDAILLILAVTVIIIWAGACCACFFLGYKLGCNNKPHPIKNDTKLTDEEKRTVEQFKKELDNMMSYDGTKQE